MVCLMADRTSPEFEIHIRRLRDIVFGVPSSQNNWDACKENWMRPDSILWLEGEAQATARKNRTARSFSRFRRFIGLKACSFRALIADLFETK